MCFVVDFVVNALKLSFVDPQAQPGQQLASAARTSPAEAFWRAALPGAPMPEALLELLHHVFSLTYAWLRVRAHAESAGVPDGVAEGDYNDNDPPPPMNFNYDDYRALPRSRTGSSTNAAAPRFLYRAGVRNDAATRVDNAATMVFFLEDAVRVGESLPLLHGTQRRAAAGAGASAGLDLYAVRSVRAVEGPGLVVCRGDAAGHGHGAVYGCRAVGPAARVYALALAGDEDAAAVLSAVAVCRTDTARWDPEHAAFRLLGVKPGGPAVCHAVPNAQVLLSAKNGESPSAN
uniref:RAFTIN1-like protein n=1 Tax=Brachypodium sylvaticum TaxID=29664 RepID=Q2L3D6_BRASY|nr:RAFTIN1-like protein [Brachypodium sylvaticum]